MNENPFGEPLPEPPSEETPSPEGESKYSGKPEIRLESSYEEYINARWPGAIIENVPPETYGSFLGTLGLETDEVTISKINSDVLEIEGNLIDITSNYVSGIDVHQLFKTTGLNLEKYQTEDIIFVDKKTGKSFNLKSIMPSDVPIEIDPQLQFQAWGGESISIPPLGRGSPPFNPLARGMWNVYKKVEPLVIFHEVAHTKQNFDTRKVEEEVESERDAWRFGLQCLRKLKAEGIDLMPDVSNDEIISRLELGLLRYDSAHPEQLPKRFSRRMTNTPEHRFTLIHDLKHLLKFIDAVFETAANDTSLITETISYRGKK